MKLQYHLLRSRTRDTEKTNNLITQDFRLSFVSKLYFTIFKKIYNSQTKEKVTESLILC